MSLEAQSLAPLFDLSRDAVVALRDGRVLFANPAAQTLLSVRAGDDAAAFLPEHVLSEPAERFVTSGAVAGQAADIAAVRSGELTLLTVTLRRDPHASLPLRDRALSEMGGNLMNLRLAADGLVRGSGAEMDDKLRSYAAVLYQSYFRLKRLQEHVNLAGYLLQGNAAFSPRLVELDDLCAQLCATVESLVRDMGIGLTFEAAESPCRAAADPRLMETLLLNLLANSLLHAAAGDRLRVTLSARGGRIVLAVDDPGTGMPAERLAELFRGLPESDMTDVTAGAGFGMTIVRGIAELHGGSVLVESREGSGTRVRVSLPKPSSEELSRLRQPDSFRPDGMSAVLTELSVVLDKSFYNQKYYD